MVGPSGLEPLKVLPAYYTGGKGGKRGQERVKKLIAGKRAKRKTRTFDLYAIFFGQGDIFYPLENGRFQFLPMFLSPTSPLVHVLLDSRQKRPLGGWPRPRCYPPGGED